MTSIQQPTATEGWYLDCYRILAQHLGRAPRVVELAQYCRRSLKATHAALMRLHRRGILRRTADRRFVLA